MANFSYQNSFAETNPRLGHTAFAYIAGTHVYPTSGTAESKRELVAQEFADNGVSPGQGARAKGLHAHGTELDGGSVSFDYANKGGSLFALLDGAVRGYYFSVAMGTSNFRATIDNCLLESLTINGRAGGLLSGTISFKSLTEWNLGSDVDPGLGKGQLIEYWRTGSSIPSSNVIEWALSISQALKPVYRNDPSNARPLYIRMGRTEANLQITTLAGMAKFDTISIGVGNRTIKGMVTDQAMELASRSALNRFRYTVTAVGENGPLDNVLYPS